MTPVRFLTWLVLWSVLFSLWALAWSLPRLGGVAISLLDVVSMAMVLAILLVIWILPATLIGLHEIVFLIGGAASILYLSNPTAGILLIAASVRIEYENKRRPDQRHREEIGRLSCITMP